MIKKNLLKTVMLGFCMAALTTAPAYAMLAEEPAPSVTEDASPETKALYAKQGEFDKILFETNSKAIEDLGFMVNYTQVVEDYIEIGISPFSDANADFIYELVGKDGVKVVEFDQSIIYAGGIAQDSAADDAVTDAEVIMEKDDNSETTPEEEELTIQIESIDADDANEEEKVYKNTSADGEEVQVVSASDEAENDESVTPMVVLAIVGGAALIGGAVVLSSKKKATK